LKPDHQLYAAKTDIDNMLKFIMDAMHKVLYDDDTAIVDAHVVKEFVSDLSYNNVNPYTTISIFAKNNTNNYHILFGTKLCYQ
jgi:Endodeoxyribonuclease RusA